MAITAQQKANLLGVTSFMFNYAPDQDSFGRFEAIIEANPSFYALGTNLARTEAYQSQFAEGITRDEKIDVILGRLGLTEGAGYETGVNFIKARLDAGIPEGQVLMEIGEKMLQDPAPAGLEEASAIFQNKIAASEAYLESGIAGYSSDTLPDLLANITADAASVEEAQAAIDAVANEGETFSLTAAGDERFVGTANNDTFEAAAGTLQSTDVIVDGSSTDNDTLNAVYKNADITAAATPTISGVENINVNIDAFDGTTATFDATNVTGATITLASTKLGFNGTAGVAAAGDNNVTAGQNVTDLTVADLTTGTVDAGAAETVNVSTAAAADDEINLTANGDVDATVNFTGGPATETLNLVAAAASVVTLNAASVVTPANLTIAGSGELSLAVDAADVTGATITGVDVLDIATAGAVDAENFTVNSIEASVTGTTVSNANGQVVDLSAADATLTVTGDGTTGAAVTVNVNADQDTGGTLSVTGVDSSVINLSDAVTEFGTSVTIDGEATINVAGDVTIASLIRTNATDSVVLAGAGNVTLTTTDLESIDASGLTGALVIEANTGDELTVVGGTGDNEVVAADADVSFTGQGGNDTVDAQAVVTATADVAVAGGAGDDVLMVNAPTATVAFDGGEGTDTLWLANGADLQGTDLSLSGVERIEIENATVGGAGEALSATVNGSQLSGESYTITSAEAADTVTLNVTADEATTDLGSLTLENIDSVVITGQPTAETIVGTSADDTIIAGGGADTLTGGAGADTFVFATGESVEGAVASITDFNTSQFDVLDLVVGAVGVDTAGTDVSGADADGAAADITANVVNGIVTLSGNDAAAIDTLAEWVDVVETAGVLDDGAAAQTGTVAFEFDGNTYVYEATAGAADNLVELTGVTGLAAVNTSAGVDTLVIA